MIEIKPGTMLLIKTDGTEQVLPLPTLDHNIRFTEIGNAIGAAMLDFVPVGKAWNSDIIMAVDDDGWNYEVVQHSPNHFEHRVTTPRKPINARATELYLAICLPGTTHKIAGDVVLLHDGE